MRLFRCARGRGQGRLGRCRHWLCRIVGGRGRLSSRYMQSAKGRHRKEQPHGPRHRRYQHLLRMQNIQLKVGGGDNRIAIEPPSFRGGSKPRGQEARTQSASARNGAQNNVRTAGDFIVFRSMRGPLKILRMYQRAADLARTRLVPCAHNKAGHPRWPFFIFDDF
jgi:hypothetical protein